jgi:hypothetical protein
MNRADLAWKATACDAMVQTRHLKCGKRAVSLYDGDGNVAHGGNVSSNEILCPYTSSGLGTEAREEMEVKHVIPI